MYKSFFGNIGGNLVLFKVHFRHIEKNPISYIPGIWKNVSHPSCLLRSLIPFRIACFFKRRVGLSMGGMPSRR